MAPWRRAVGARALAGGEHRRRIVVDEHSTSLQRRSGGAVAQRAPQRGQLGDQALDHRPQTGPRRFDHAIDAVPAERAACDRSDGDRPGRTVHRPGQAVGIGCQFEDVVDGHSGRERQGVDAPGDSRGDEALRRLLVVGELPPIHRHVDDVRAEGPDPLGDDVAATVPLDGDALAAHVERGEELDDLVARLARRLPGDVEAASDRRARAPSSLARGRPPRDSPRRRASSSPPLSATPSQDLVPTPVVSTMTSTVPASSSVVARVVTLTSSRATVRSTGPWTTSAPRRVNISACSAARRSPVMPIENPDSGAIPVEDGGTVLQRCFGTITSRAPPARWWLATGQRRTASRAVAARQQSS